MTIRLDQFRHHSEGERERERERERGVNAIGKVVGVSIHNQRC